jgi:Fur family transcriptional regulator, ferric uptake regulator
MAQNAPAPSALADRFEAAKLSATPNRLLVLRELARERDDATAQQLHQRLARRGHGIGLATVYRALAAMSEAGIIDALPHGSTETCYRLCGEGHHHHLVCSKCHRVIELHGCPAESWIDDAAQAQGFAVTEHRLEAVGICSDCRG